jgi:hypothetical protein
MFSRILVSLLALVWVSTSAEAGPRLTTTQISALAPGYYAGTWKGKRQLYLKLSPDGTISGTVDGARHSGRWYVSNGNLCLVFRILVLQKTKCGTIHRDGSWIVGYYKKGKPRIRLRLVEGTKA